MNWKELSQLSEFEELSSSVPNYVIFKHSTRCPVSFAAKRRFEEEWKGVESDPDVYYLDLIANRDVSNRIAEKLSVVHQSPQVIVVKNGEVVHHASHMSVNADKVLKHIQN